MVAAEIDKRLTAEFPEYAARGAKRPVLGVGNPLLDGDPLDAAPAKLTREKQTCPQTPWQRVAGLVEKRRSVQKVATRGGHADLHPLRLQVPLHDTADAPSAVANALRFAPDDILQGPAYRAAFVVVGEGPDRKGTARACPTSVPVSFRTSPRLRYCAARAVRWSAKDWRELRQPILLRMHP